MSFGKCYFGSYDGDKSSMIKMWFCRTLCTAKFTWHANAIIFIQFWSYRRLYYIVFGIWQLFLLRKIVSFNYERLKFVSNGTSFNYPLWWHIPERVINFIYHFSTRLWPFDEFIQYIYDISRFETDLTI